jgi:putative Mg2+ transporter-C (MgtC) family protein
MQITLSWLDIALRLGLTLLAGAVIGVNRGERGRPAGLRTTMLVCLAASLSMILANLLLSTTGRHPDAFATMDPMRLPLGILTGMGFIGAGAILRRKDLIVGITTAAALWFVTVMGLCIGSGQFALGLAALALGYFVLEMLQHAERHMRQDRTAILTLLAAADGPTYAHLAELLSNAGFTLIKCATTHLPRAHKRSYLCEVRWHARPSDAAPPAFLDELAQRPGVLKIQWRP